MTRARTVLLSVVAPTLFAAAVTWFSIYAMGNYGWTIFLLLPYAIGYSAGSCVALFRPGRFHLYLLAAFTPLILLALGFLIVRAEGLICVALAAPLVLPISALGARAAYKAYDNRPMRRAVTSALLVAITFGAAAIEPRLHNAPEAKIVSDAVVVAAPAAAVWGTIVHLSDVAPPNDWLYRAGLACPRRTRILRGAPGGLRVCTLSTGRLVERIVAWQPKHLLRWRSVEVPPPMHELNPFGEVDAPHLHGYYDVPYGEFAIESIDSRRTRVIRRTWYTQRLYPTAYWSIWSELAISHVHRTVLEQIQSMSSPKV